MLPTCFPSTPHPTPLHKKRRVQYKTKESLEALQLNSATITSESKEIEQLRKKLAEIHKYLKTLRSVHITVAERQQKGSLQPFGTQNKFEPRVASAFVSFRSQGSLLIIMGHCFRCGQLSRSKAAFTITGCGRKQDRGGLKVGRETSQNVRPVDLDSL